MTENDVLKIMSVLKVAYPAYYAKTPPQELEAAVRLWQELFAEDDYQAVSAAVKTFIAEDTQGYPPNIGKIKAILYRLFAPRPLSETEAWQTVCRAMRNSTYHAREEFDRLPSALQRLVGGPSQLREWAMLSVQEVQTVVQSHFVKSYRSFLQEEAQQRAVAALGSRNENRIENGE